MKLREFIDFVAKLTDHWRSGLMPLTMYRHCKNRDVHFILGSSGPHYNLFSRYLSKKQIIALSYKLLTKNDVSTKIKDGCHINYMGYAYKMLRFEETLDKLCEIVTID